jgi:ABC-type lipoprotein release transport system permease subunit
MFITYLLRELRRRMRQAIFIAAGLAVGVGLVVTVTAASDGVSAGQGTVLRSLYGVGTDVTVTQSPSAGSGGPTRFNVGGGASGQQKAGTSFSRDILAGGGLGTLKSSSVTTVSGLNDVSGAAGALVLNDVQLSGTVSASGGQSGSQGGAGAGSVKSNSFSVTGIDPSDDSLGPLSSGTITSGHSITTAESGSNVAVVDSNYAAAQNLKTGSKITVAGKTFSVVGIVLAGQGVSSADVYIPLARAQTLADMTGEVNTLYVSAASASDIAAVSTGISHALPTATVTTSSDLASEVTGSLSSASTLASNLGKWLAVAVLAAAFGLASILTMAAVTRRVREFGTLKAMGWRSRRIIRQIIGEALVIGVAGGAAGVAIGYGAAALVQALAPPLTASTAPASSAAASSRFTHAAPAAHTISVHLTTPVTLGAVHALRGVNLIIEDGDWLAIQDLTGHGKTTLLQILGSLDRPTSGTAELDRHNLTALPENQLTRVHLPSELSGGQQQRVAQRNAIMRDGQLTIPDSARHARTLLPGMTMTLPQAPLRPAAIAKPDGTN